MLARTIRALTCACSKPLSCSKNRPCQPTSLPKKSLETLSLSILQYYYYFFFSSSPCFHSGGGGIPNVPTISFMTTSFICRHQERETLSGEQSVAGAYLIPCSCFWSCCHVAFPFILVLLLLLLLLLLLFFILPRYIYTPMYTVAGAGQGLHWATGSLGFLCGNC
jgi:hypothetical protein